jgi:serine peptidase DegS
MAFVARAAMAGLAVAFVVVYLWPGLAAKKETGSNGSQAAGPPAPASYADAVNRTAPAVVSIHTRSFRPQAMSRPGHAGQLMMWRITADQGSGVILSEDGYILTNHHVIENANHINVALWDGRMILSQKVGVDPATDLAVLKVDLDDLPAAPVGDAGALRVGDVVLAIGNSMGLRNSVTLGIVSATGRNDLQSTLYQDYIQTDAAINQGNSGGALINAAGDLVGINTLNADPLRGSQNIGFAIPIGLALDVMNQIIENGSVSRGWLGADFSDLHAMPLPDGSILKVGVSVGRVQRDGPAWNAGLKPGDLILSLDGESFSDAGRFRLAISQREPGSQVELEVHRDRATFMTYATLIQQPPQ